MSVQELLAALMLGTNEQEIAGRRGFFLCSPVEGVLHGSHSGCIRRTQSGWMEIP